MKDYNDCVEQKRHWMNEAKTPGLENEVRRLFISMAVMYRRYALQWKHI